MVAGLEEITGSPAMNFLPAQLDGEQLRAFILTVVIADDLSRLS
jgi:hypothetical protein